MVGQCTVAIVWRVCVCVCVCIIFGWTALVNNFCVSLGRTYLLRWLLEMGYNRVRSIFKFFVNVSRLFHHRSPCIIIKITYHCHCIFSLIKLKMCVILRLSLNWSVFIFRKHLIYDEKFLHRIHFVEIALTQINIWDRDSIFLHIRRLNVNKIKFY